MIWTRITLYSALGLTLNAMAAQWDTWQFWCVVGLFWASEHLTRLELVETINQEVKRLKAEHKNKEQNND